MEQMMEWLQVLTIIAGIGGIVMWMVQRLDNDVKAIGHRLDIHETKFNEQGQRTDRLYQMFVDLLKDKRS